MSGATVSSRGILNAVKDALRKASNGNNSLDINSPDETEQNIPSPIPNNNNFFKELSDFFIEILSFLFLLSKTAIINVINVVCG